MTEIAADIRADHHGPPPIDRAVSGGFATIDDGRYARIANVDAMAPFLVSIASDSDVWLFVGSNGPFTAGRHSPDHALFPYQTVDKILRDPATGGARSTFLVSRAGQTSLWEPWLGSTLSQRVSRSLYKRTDGTGILFEEIAHDLGLRFRWELSASARFGVIRHAWIDEIAGDPVSVRYLDGWHQLIPPGVDQETYARLSYLAAAYMRHERVPEVPLAIYTLNTAISDRPEPAESLRGAGAWSVGHPAPVILLGDGQVAAFRRGEAVQAEVEARGEMGAYLVADQVELPPHGQHDWYTVGDTALDHGAILDLRDLLRRPNEARAALEAAIDADRRGVRRRVAGADGLQQGADEAATANHYANTLYNIMRGGSFERGYEIPTRDLAAYLHDQDRAIFERHREWIEGLPVGSRLEDLIRAASERGDAQLVRLVRTYLPLTFSRRHGDPSRPWNRFTIRVRDEAGAPVYHYEGNWRDIFQNWEALGESFPGFLPQFISVFLDASTADGYNPYRITRSGIDWEVDDPRDPWSHIGYWGDHQIVYLARLLDAYERHAPGALASGLGERVYGYADVPYRIAILADIVADPRRTIVFDQARHDALIAARQDVGSDATLLRDEHGSVRLVTLGEKLLVPVLVKLTNLVPGSGIWLNTQRPEWNDANNALAGWGLSLVTLSAICRYLDLLRGLLAGDGELELSQPVARLLQDVTDILAEVDGPVDDTARYAVMARLGRVGEEHRYAVYAGAFGDPVATPFAAVRGLLAQASRVAEATIRGARRSDGLYHSYDLLRVDGERAAIRHLGPMLEGQVAVLDSGLLGDAEAVDLLRALRASGLYRADQHSYLLYPDHPIEPFLGRNTLASEPPLADPALFVVDRSGRWHFQADLSTVADVDRALASSGAPAATRAAVRDLWRATFAHEEFTGRSGRFFMFEGLGSIYWHMVAKLLLAVEGCHRRATEPAAVEALAEIYQDIRDGLGFRKTPSVYGAFPTDPYSHTPGHRGAQQPGMTGQVKEQLLARFGELGVEVRDGCLHLEPRLLPRSEFADRPLAFRYVDVQGTEAVCDVPAGSVAFTYCQVPVVIQLGEVAAIELDRADGSTEIVPGAQLDRAATAAIVERRGIYRRLLVTVPADTPWRP